MRPTIIRQAMLPEPPGWDQKVAYQKGGLTGIATAIGLSVLVACYLLRGQKDFGQTVRFTPEDYTSVMMQTLGMHSSGNSGATLLLPADAPRSGVFDARRMHIMPDEAPSAKRVNVQQFEIPASGEAKADLLADLQGGYLARLTSVPIMSTAPNLQRRPILPLGDLVLTGIEDLEIQPGDKVVKPVIDLRYIVSPVTDLKGDTNIAVVDIFFSKDSFNVKLLSETNPYIGYGSATVSGLYKGHHEPLLINGAARAISMELEVKFCRDCDQINYTVQKVLLRH
ncbi:MAG: hypothetical protein Q8O51_02925 [bacterium]|nr:hypothetical protein [bacterium]